MHDSNIILPSKPRVMSETETRGVYETDGLYPGYGHTLGNSLRRIIWSSMVGTAVTAVKIDGVSHEFDTLEGVKEDVIQIILNLKKVHFRLNSDEPQRIRLEAKGKREVTAKDIDGGSQVEILNPEAPIASLTAAGASLAMELTVEKGLGYVSKESLERDRTQTQLIYLDAVFTPIRNVFYEVENMRVGDRTDFNRLRLTIETNGTVTPRAVLERSIELMIAQLQAMIGFKQAEVAEESESKAGKTEEKDEAAGRVDQEVLKTKIEDLELSGRTANALQNASIRSLGGLARKKEEDLLALPGLGEKGLQEVKRALARHGLVLK